MMREGLNGCSAQVYREGSRVHVPPSDAAPYENNSQACTARLHTIRHHDKFYILPWVIRAIHLRYRVTVIECRGQQRGGSVY